MRSGSTLQYNLVSEIIERKKVGFREVWITNHKAYFQKRRGGRIISFKSHALTPQIASLLDERRAVSLTCFRDVRDAVASWQAKQRQRLSVEEGLRFASQIIALFKRWEDLPSDQTLCSKYEKLVLDTGAEVARIARFLGVNVEPDEISAIVKVCSPSSFRRRLESMEPEMMSRMNSACWDTKTLVHVDHLNGGIVGRAASELSVDLFESLTDLHGEWLLDHGYALRC